MKNNPCFTLNRDLTRRPEEKSSMGKFLSPLSLVFSFNITNHAPSIKLNVERGVIYLEYSVLLPCPEAISGMALSLIFMVLIFCWIDLIDLMPDVDFSSISVKQMMGPAPHTQLDADLAAGMGMPDNGPKLMSV